MTPGGMLPHKSGHFGDLSLGGPRERRASNYCIFLPVYDIFEKLLSSYAYTLQLTLRKKFTSGDTHEENIPQLEILPQVQRLMNLLEEIGIFQIPLPLVTLE